jgi:DNA-binding GntR family transcriptional regulator
MPEHMRRELYIFQAASLTRAFDDMLYTNMSQRPAKAFEKINMRMPSAEGATLLNISRSQPVVEMDRWVWANDETLFEYSRIIANAALHEYTYEYDISEEASK